MQLHIATGDGLPIYLQIMNQIKYQVASGRLTQGEQLPPVRKLAEQLVVNPNTVSRAYRELETEGIVKSRQGAGVFVAEGISPLAEREQTRILSDRIDQLLAEARHMNVGLDALISLLQKRSQEMGS
jgi:GntR family transcriptional regulator